MNAKWCVSTLFIILAFLGLSQGQNRSSNQQILLQFADVELASETTHDDILAVIAKKLEALGIYTIEIVESDGTQLSIRYYSDVDAVSVKEFLSNENHISLTNEEKFPLDFPKEQLPENYNLVVSDLHQQADDSFALDGTLVLVQKHVNQRFFNPVILPFNRAIVLQEDTSTDVSYKINRNIALSIDNTSQIIPEVRAGPYVYGNN